MQKISLLLSLILVSALSITIISCMNPVGVTEFNEGNFIYQEDSNNNEGVQLVNYTGSDSVLIILSRTTSGKTITGISENAFFNKGLTHLELPASITNIGDAAFAANPALSSIEFKGSSASVNVWGGSPEGILQGTLLEGHFKKVEHGTVRQGLYEYISGLRETIEDYSYNFGTIQRYIPASGIPEEQGGTEASIAEYLGSETALSIPETVVSGAGRSYTVSAVGPHAFASKNLTLVQLPAGIRGIGDAAFADNAALSSVEFKGSSALVNAWGGSPEGIFWGTLLEGHVKKVDNGKVLQGLYETIEAVSETIGDYRYNLGTIHRYIPASGIPEEQGGTEASIAEYLGSEAILSIPESIVSESGNRYTVGSIGPNAFSGRGLTLVQLPGSITSIGDAAFADNAALSSVEFKGAHTAVTAWGESPNGIFRGTLLEGHVKKVDNGKVLQGLYETIEGVSETIGDYRYNLGTIHRYTSASGIPEEQGGTEASIAEYLGSETILSIPESVVSGSGSRYGVSTIGSNAFLGKGLTFVQLPGSITSIGYAAFADNAALSSVEFQGSHTAVTSWGEDPNGIFKGTLLEDHFKKVDNGNALPGLYEYIAGLSETIGDYTYDFGSAEQRYTPISGIPEELVGSETTITAYAGSDTDLSIPESVTRSSGRIHTVGVIGDSVFASKGLVSLVIPASIMRINASVFADNAALSSVEFKGSHTAVTSWGEDPNGIFKGTLLEDHFKKVDNGNALPGLYEYFAGFSETIGDYTYDFGSAEQRYTPISGIPEELVGSETTITAYAGSDTDLRISESVTRSSGRIHTVSVIGDSVFASKGLVSLVIPASITRIDDGAFANNALLTSVRFEGANAAITAWGANPNGIFKGTLLENHFKKVNSANVLPGLYEYIPGISETIGDYTYAFGSVRQRYTPNSGSPEEQGGNSETIVTAYTGSDIDLTIPTSVTRSNSQIHNVDVIGNSVFANKGLVSLVIPASITRIDDGAFAHNALLASVRFEGANAAITAWGANPNGIFKGTLLEEHFKKVDNANALPGLYEYIAGISETIGDYTYDFGSAEQRYTPLSGTPEELVGSRTTITAYIGSDTDLSIPDSVTRRTGRTHTIAVIGNSAFANKGLVSLVVPASISLIANKAFAYNPNLASVKFEGGSTVISQWFYGVFEGTKLHLHFRSTVQNNRAARAGLYQLVPQETHTIDDFTYVFHSFQRYVPINGNEELNKTWISRNIIDYTGNATDITIPESIPPMNNRSYPILYIASHAFSNKNLTSVVLPSSLRSISSNAFSQNPLLGSVEFKGHEAWIDIWGTASSNNGVFNGTLLEGHFTDFDGPGLGYRAVPKGLYETIPGRSLTQGDFVYSLGALQRYTPPPHVGVPQEKGSASEATISQYIGTSQDITIPERVTLGNTYSISTIEPLAFANKNLRSVVLPATVALIEDRAFSDNSELISVEFMSSNTALKANVFENSDFAEPVYKGSDGSLVNLTNATIEEGLYSSFRFGAWTEGTQNTVEVSAYNRIAEITDLIIPASVVKGGIGYEVTSIAAEAFNNQNLNSVVLPPTITNIGSKAFSYNYIKRVDLSGNTVLETIGSEAFRVNYIESIALPASVTTIGHNAFKANDLISIMIPDSVSSIGERAFYYNDIETTDFSRATNLRSIGPEAFSSNDLVIVDLSANTNLKSIGAEAFKKNSITSVNLPPGSTDLSIGSKAFSNNLISNITIPSGITSLGDEVLTRNLLTAITFEGSGTVLGNDVCLYNPVHAFSDLGNGMTPRAQTYSLIIDNDIYYAINNGVAAIGGRVSLSSKAITIPAAITHNSTSYNVTKIADWAFGEKIFSDGRLPGPYFDKVNGVDFSGATNLVSIGFGAFYDTEIEAVDLSTALSLKTIHGSAFQWTPTRVLHLPANLENLDENAFFSIPLIAVTIDAVPAPNVQDNTFYHPDGSHRRLTFSIPDAGDTSGYPAAGETWGGRTWPAVTTHTVTVP